MPPDESLEGDVIALAEKLFQQLVVAGTVSGLGEG
jgi:hypothetical protein